MNPAPQDIFASEAKLISALSVVRQAAIEPAKKDSLRNLILSYAGESDEGKRAELQKRITGELAAYPELASLIGSSQTDASAPGQTAGEANRLGFTRPVPTFAASVPAKEEKAAPVEAAGGTADKPAPAPASASVPAPVPETPVPTAAATIGLKSRIDEIKRTINGKVGNPVNLIEADEKTGREYMSALLDAMKSAGGGGNEAAAAARLESAYQAALALAERMPAETKPATPAPARPPDASPAEPPAPAQKISEEAPVEPRPAEPSAEPAPIEPQPEEPITTQAPAAAVPEEPPTQAAAVPIEKPKEAAPDQPPPNTGALYHQPVDETEAAEKEEKKTGLSALTGLWHKDEKTSLQEATAVSPRSTAAAAVRKLNIEAPAAPKRSLSVQSEAAAASEEAATPAKAAAPLRPLKDATTLPEQMARVKEEAQKREEAAKRPITDLNAPEIQSGLEQLLSEWSLFRSSGFLGTGPRGANHPLYKALANLPMAAVVAGRFEGMTPEIKQSLTDYMNGWRYEQGIVHEMGETFEHYLRRVIKQIITRQRMAPPA